MQLGTIANDSFDEPALKATFASTLIIPSHLTALSNMPVKSEKPVDDGSKKAKGPSSQNLKRVEFEETPIMSTYVPPLYPPPDYSHEILLISASGICIW